MAGVFRVDTGLGTWLKRAFLDNVDAEAGADENNDDSSLDQPRPMPPWYILATSQAHCRDIEGAIKKLEEDPALFLRATEDLPHLELTADTSKAAGAALEAHATLRQLRFELVPRIISEDEFWQRYFAAVQHIADKLLGACPATCAAMSCSTSSAGTSTTAPDSASWSFMDDSLLATCTDKLQPQGSLRRRRGPTSPHSPPRPPAEASCHSALSSDAAMVAQPSSGPTSPLPPSPCDSLDMDLLSLAGLPDLNGMLFGDLGLAALWQGYGAGSSSSSSSSSGMVDVCGRQEGVEAAAGGPSAGLAREYISSLALADVQFLECLEGGQAQAQCAPSPQHVTAVPQDVPASQGGDSSNEQQQQQLPPPAAAVPCSLPLPSLPLPSPHHVALLWEEQWGGGEEGQWAGAGQVSQCQQQQQQQEVQVTAPAQSIEVAATASPAASSAPADSCPCLGAPQAVDQPLQASTTSSPGAPAPASTTIPAAPPAAHPSSCRSPSCPSDDMSELPLSSPHHAPALPAALHLPVKAAAVRKLADAFITAQQLKLQALADLAHLHITPALGRLQSGPTMPNTPAALAGSSSFKGSPQAPEGTLGLGRMLAAVRSKAPKPDSHSRVMQQIWGLFERLEGGAAAAPAAAASRCGSRLPVLAHGSHSSDFLVDVATEVAGLSTLSDMAAAWQEVVQELQLRWASAEGVPGLPSPAASQPSDLPLHLYLLLLNLCISHKLQQQGCRAAAAGSSGMVRDSSGMAFQRQGALRAVPQLQMALTGEPVYEPERQEFALHARALLAQLPGSRVAGLLDRGHAQLTSDISAFKAANPGCVLQDCMAWSAAVRAAASSAAGTAMTSSQQLDLATWQEVFDRAPPVAACRQVPLLDAAVLAEEVLEALACMAPAELMGQMMMLLARAVLSGAGAYSCHSRELAAAVVHASAAVEQVQLVASSSGWCGLDADSLDMLLATLDAAEDALLRLAAGSAAGATCAAQECVSEGSAGAAGSDAAAGEAAEEAWVLL